MRTILILSILLVSCGGGGGAGGAGSGETGAQRAVPGGSVSLRAATGGGFTVSTSVPDVASIDVLAGSDYETAVPVTMSNVGSGTWRGSGASGGILVRLTLTDGSIIETASGDFALR